MLGLEHSEHFEDVMSPYYIPDQLAVSDNDMDICSALWKKKGDKKGDKKGKAQKHKGKKSRNELSGFAKLSDA